MNSHVKQDALEFAASFEFANRFAGAKILITGATGLVGSTLVNCLLALDKGTEITCPIRSLSKARNIYSESFNKIRFIECDLMNYLDQLSGKDRYDYIIHCASPTEGKYMKEHPVETYELAIESTRLLLRHAVKTSVKGMVYISSLEYYGQMLQDDTEIQEDFLAYIDDKDTRSSYPLGKRAAEFLCFAYANEYGLNVKSARLTQTFGAGVSITDNRVFAQFARSVIEGRDIVLHTKGESAKPYCYTTDCAAAILYILLKGEKGESYNVANPETYINIRQLAAFLKDNFSPSISIIIEEHPEFGYAPVTKLNLSVKKLMNLGWKPKFGLKEMFEKLINYMSDEKNN